jgi:hypothetical protein
MGPGQDGEGLPMSTLGLLDEVAIQTIAVRGARSERRTSLLSGRGQFAFKLPQ